MNETDHPPLRKTFFEKLEHAAQHLPEGYSIVLHVEKGNADVQLMRPDESHLSMQDYYPYTPIDEQFDQAVKLAQEDYQTYKEILKQIRDEGSE